jgi:S-adenosylmethionine:tRNA ribosyltransferase-isomerase
MRTPREHEDPLRILDDYDFELPEHCIAQRPAPSRDAARLLVLDRDSGAVVESGPAHRVGSLPSWLRAGDLLIVNVTRVLPARLVGRKSSGGAVDALLLGPDREADSFRALLKCSGRLRVGLEFDFGSAAALPATLVALHERGEVTLRFEKGADPYLAGQAPLPPYIRRGSDAEQRMLEDHERYQTVYAREPGAIAAPTAGLHLTEALLAQLRSDAVEIAEVVLHVGHGSFRPLDREALESGRLHAERFELPAATAAAIGRARAAGGRVIAVGTTTTRVLESRADDRGGVEAGVGETDLFVRPGGPPFRVVDGLLTNFHLPRSSLLLLVAAFVGRTPLLAAYHEAIAGGFRFYSYGDAMLILPQPRRLGGG